MYGAGNMPNSISSKIERELAAGLSMSVTDDRIMPIIIGSMKPCMKIATHNTIMKIR